MNNTTETTVTKKLNTTLTSSLVAVIMIATMLIDVIVKTIGMQVFGSLSYGGIISSLLVGIALVVVASNIELYFSDRKISIKVFKFIKLNLEMDK